MTSTRLKDPIDFNHENVLNQRLENLKTDPTTNLTIGRTWLNTTTHQVKVVTQTGTIAVLGSSGGVAKFAATVGDGTTTAITVTHNLNTLDVASTSVYTVATGAEVPAANRSITGRTLNSVTITFTSAPAANSTRVVVIG